MPRFTVRRLMAAVAILAVLLGISAAWRRRAAFLERSETHSGWKDHFDHMLVCIECSEDEGADAARSRRGSEYHGSLAAKYERAAGRPWLSVEPDPPEPGEREARDATSVPIDW